LYLLNTYDNIREINFNENQLITHGYDPVLLTECGTYQKAVEFIDNVNENILSTIGGLLKTMTENFSAIGIFQFVLDIIGVIPAAMFGFPVDVIANALNAVISFARKNYLMGFINAVSCFDLTKFFAPFKFGAKAVAKPLSAAIQALVNGTSGKVVADVLKADSKLVKTPGIFAMFGKMLGGLATWLAKTGVNLLKSVMPSISKAISKITFGAIKADKLLAKSTEFFDNLALKMQKFGKEAQAASAEILSKNTAKAADTSIATAAKGVGDAAAAGVAKNAQNMVSGFTAQTILNRVGKVGGFTDKIVLDISKSEKFLKLVKKGAPLSVQNNYIYREATRELAQQILSKKVGLLSITKNKTIMATLGAGSTWKGADKLLVNAIKKGNPEELGKVMKAMMDDPAFFKLISKTSPSITKSMALFKEMPEVLINGSKTFSEFAQLGAKFAWKASYRKTVLGNFLAFMIKQSLKTDCGKYITSAESATDTMDRVVSTAQTKIPSIPGTKQETALGPLTEILAKVIIEQEEPQVDMQQLSAETLAKFKESDPEGYAQLAQTTQEMQTAANDLKKKTDLTNPCYGETALGQAKVGAIINANTAWQGNGQVARDLTTPTDFKDSNLNNIQKQQLAILKQDTDIDAQHPLADSNPEVKAYFSDVVNYNGSISPNENKLSRLDEVLDEMVKAGEITEEQKPRIRQLSLDHWTNGTVPTGIFTDKNAEQPTNESMFKIGKLITVR
jgi:hypothetical protein